MTTKAQQEIELKFETTAQALAHFRQHVAVRLEAQGWSLSEGGTRPLINTYYDTPALHLRHAGAGLRVRVTDQGIEQTLKVDAPAVSGIPQRWEYHHALTVAQPQLEHFTADMWPAGLDVKAFTAAIVPLFSTDFTRTSVVLSRADTQIELVFDNGQVCCQQQVLPLCEFELELWQGEPRELLSVANLLAQTLPARLCNTSKAARGYYLLQRTPPAIRALLPEACHSAQAALAHWQWHEDALLLTADPAYENAVREGINLTQAQVKQQNLAAPPTPLLLHKEALATPAYTALKLHVLALSS